MVADHVMFKDVVTNHMMFGGVVIDHVAYAQMEDKVMCMLVDLSPLLP